VGGGGEGYKGYASWPQSGGCAPAKFVCHHHGRIFFNPQFFWSQLHEHGVWRYNQISSWKSEKPLHHQVQSARRCGTIKLAPSVQRFVVCNPSAAATAAAMQCTDLCCCADPDLELQFEEAWAEDYCKFSSQWWTSFFLLQIVIIIHLSINSPKEKWQKYTGALWTFNMFGIVVLFHFISTRFKPGFVVTYYSEWCWASSIIVALAYLQQQIYLDDFGDSVLCSEERDYKMFLTGAHFMIEILVSHSRIRSHKAENSP
jgi:hypothetical protein